MLFRSKLSSSAQPTQQPVGTNPAQSSAQPSMNAYNPWAYNASGKGPNTSQPASAYNYMPSGPVMGPTDPNAINSSYAINRAPIVAPPPPAPLSAAQLALNNFYNGFGGFNGYGMFADGGKVDGGDHEELLKLAREILRKRGE